MISLFVLLMGTDVHDKRYAGELFNFCQSSSPTIAYRTIRIKNTKEINKWHLKQSFHTIVGFFFINQSQRCFSTSLHSSLIRLRNSIIFAINTQYFL